MITQSSDTNIRTEKVLISLLREKNTANKFSQICSLTQTTIQLSKRAILRSQKKIDKRQLNLIFIDLHYGRELADKVKIYLDKKYGKS